MTRTFMVEVEDSLRDAKQDIDELEKNGEQKKLSKNAILASIIQKVSMMVAVGAIFARNTADGRIRYESKRFNNRTHGKL